MSRSRSKNPISKDYRRNATKFYKQLANKTVRKHRGCITDGKGYRKLYCSYNIHDFRFMEWDPENKWYELLKRK